MDHGEGFGAGMSNLDDGSSRYAPAYIRRFNACYDEHLSWIWGRKLARKIAAKSLDYVSLVSVVACCLTLWRYRAVLFNLTTAGGSCPAFELSNVWKSAFDIVSFKEWRLCLSNNDNNNNNNKKKNETAREYRGGKHRGGTGTLEGSATVADNSAAAAAAADGYVSSETSATASRRRLGGSSSNSNSDINSASGSGSDSYMNDFIRGRVGRSAEGCSNIPDDSKQSSMRTLVLRRLNKVIDGVVVLAFAFAVFAILLHYSLEFLMHYYYMEKGVPFAARFVLHHALTCSCIVVMIMFNLTNFITVGLFLSHSVAHAWHGTWIGTVGCHWYVYSSVMFMMYSVGLVVVSMLSGTVLQRFVMREKRRDRGSGGTTSPANSSVGSSGGDGEPYWIPLLKMKRHVYSGYVCCGFMWALLAFNNVRTKEFTIMCVAPPTEVNDAYQQYDTKRRAANVMIVVIVSSLIWWYSFSFANGNNKHLTLFQSTSLMFGSNSRNTSTIIDTNTDKSNNAGKTV